MNIAQTRQIMSYIWSTHPSAPKFSDEDKVRTIASYFRVLYKFSIEDVLDAIDRVCRKSPTFIPSAYEIEAACVKTPNVEAFLPNEYHELDAQYKEYQFCVYQDLIRAECDMETAENDEDKKKAKLRFDGIRARMNIDDKLTEIYHHASMQAIEAYDAEQVQVARHDLRALGYERLALEG